MIGRRARVARRGAPQVRARCPDRLAQASTTTRDALPEAACYGIIMRSSGRPANSATEENYSAGLFARGSASRPSMARTAASCGALLGEMIRRGVAPPVPARVRRRVGVGLRVEQDDPVGVGVAQVAGPLDERVAEAVGGPALQAAVEHDVHPAARHGLAVGRDVDHALARQAPADRTRQELGLVEHDLAPARRPRPADQVGIDPAQDLAGLVVVAVVDERACIGAAGAAVVVDDQRMAGLALRQQVDRVQILGGDAGGTVEGLGRGRRRASRPRCRSRRGTDRRGRARARTTGRCGARGRKPPRPSQARRRRAHRRSPACSSVRARAALSKPPGSSESPLPLEAQPHGPPATIPAPTTVLEKASWNWPAI